MLLGVETGRSSYGAALNINVFSAIPDRDVRHVDRGGDLDLSSNGFVLEVACVDIADFDHFPGWIFPIVIRAFL